MGMTSEQMTDLLTEVLKCGYADLAILSDSAYEMGDLVEYVKGVGSEIEINNLCYAMFQLALSDVQSAIEVRQTLMLEEIETLKESELSEEQQEELEDLIEVAEMDLEIRDDSDSFHNFIDTHANLINNEELYNEYFAEELAIFEEKTGYSLV